MHPKKMSLNALPVVERELKRSILSEVNRSLSYSASGWRTYPRSPAQELSPFRSGARIPQRELVLNLNQSVRNR